MKIILADDHPLFRDGFALLLRQIEPGALVLEASDLYAAQALAAKHSDVDLVLLDLEMPGMDGGQGLERLLAQHPSLPVVVLSAHDGQESVQTVLKAGAAGFIPKASTTQVMLSAIRLVLSGGVYLPPQMIAPPHPQQAQANVSELTARQLDILRLLAKGLSNKQICRDLNLSEGTVKSHILAVYRVLLVNNRTEAAMAAKRLGLLDQGT